MRCGDLGTVTHIGPNHSMTVKMDSGKTAEISPAMARHIDYGYVVEGPDNLRAERVIATGDGLSKQAFHDVSPKMDLVFHITSPHQDFVAAKQVIASEIAQSVKQQNDFGIGF